MSLILLEHPSTKAPFFAFLLPLFLVLLELKQRFATTAVGFEPWFSAAELFLLELSFNCAGSDIFCCNRLRVLLRPGNFFATSMHGSRVGEKHSRQRR